MRALSLAEDLKEPFVDEEDESLPANPENQVIRSEALLKNWGCPPSFPSGI